MNYAAINFGEKLAKFSEHWSPKIIAQLNDYHFKLVKVQGDFVWHSHAETDEVFLVLDGEIRIDFRDGLVDLKAGEMFVVPRGDRKSTRLNSSHSQISYAVFCLKKKKKHKNELSDTIHTLSDI